MMETPAENTSGRHDEDSVKVTDSIRPSATENEIIMAESVIDEPDSGDDDPDFYHPADIAEHLENLPIKEQLEVVRNLPTEDAAEAIAELDGEQAGDLLTEMSPGEAAQIVAEMSPDDAADVLDELEDEHRDTLLRQMDTKDAEEIRSLMSFNPDTAGGIMNSEIIRLLDTMGTDQAITEVRKEMEDTEMPYYVYVIDKDEKLVGVLSLRDLMLTKRRMTLRDAVGDQETISVSFDVPREEVAIRMSRYNFATMPVVDHEGRLLGMVTYDDIMDVMQDVASEDMLGMVGAGPDETVDTPWASSVMMRLPWLLINIVTSALSAFVVYLFEGSIADMAILAVLMPMVANQAGNTGHQALAVMIRQLATETFDRKRAWIAVLRECKVGMATGLAVGVFALTAIWILMGQPVLGCVMGSALFFDMLIGALSGGAIPLCFRALGRDPAQASSIFLTALTDCAGFFIFLGLATMFLI